MFFKGWAREDMNEMNHKPSIVSQVENWGFWLSNENIVTGLISYVVPEWQKSKCVNSLLSADSQLLTM